ncbi:hypothetical protein ND973_03825 [Vibrio diabolicus]|nr:hypothetical protein [Vibrio diabolicus]
MENNSVRQINDNIFVHLEAGEHMITGETKRHKLALMITCTITCAMCILNSSKVTSLFGILKIEPDIPVLWLIPFALVITLYQAILYRYHYIEAMKEWKNKIEKKTQKRHFRHFNLISNTINCSSDKAFQKQEILTINSSQGARLERLKGFINDFSDSINKAPNEDELLEMSYLASKGVSEDHHNLIQNLERISRELDNIDKLDLDYNDISLYNKSIQHTISQAKNLSGLLKYNFLLINKANKINESFDALNKIIIDLESKYINNYNEYLIKHYDSHIEIKQLLNNCIQQRDKAISMMALTSFNENSTKIFYKWVPFFFVCFTVSISVAALIWPSVPPMILELIRFLTS